MAIRSSILAWETPWTEEPGELQSMGSQELDKTEWLNLPTYPYCWIIRFPFSASLPPAFPSFPLSSYLFMYLHICVSIYYLVVQSLSCVQLFWDPMDYNPPASSVHGILQARIREWVAVPSSRESSRPRDQTCISCLQHWKADSIQLHHQFRYYHYSPRSKRLAYKRNI